MGVTTLLDIAKANGSDPIVGLIDETSKAHPEITRVAARTIKGLSYKTLVRKTLPVVGFRSANQGVAVDQSGFENREVGTYILNPRYETDRAVADAYEDGAAAWLALEAEGTMEAAMQLMGKQFYYGGIANPSGIIADGKGNPGLWSGYSTTYEVDATGSTANSATSVWACKFGEKWVQWVFGMNGQFAMSDVALLRLTDGSGNPFTGYMQEILARPGLQFGSIRGVGHIKNLTAQPGHTLNDNLLSQLMAKFEVGVKPDVIFMNRTARQQLQASRTVTLFGNGSGQLKGNSGTVAPVPTEYDGVPIEVTDSILNTEAIS